MAGRRTKTNTRKGRKRQRSLLEQGRGGYRENGGRTRARKTKWVRRIRRDPVSAKDVIHVNIRLREGLPKLRNKRTFKVIRACFAQAAERLGFRLLHYAVMNNHFHWIVEADDRRALSRGMQGLLIRLAKALNRLWTRRGSVFSDRYHDHILRSPSELRNAIQYVLNNARKHRISFAGKLDPYASGGWFRGWAPRDQVPTWPREYSPLARPKSWLFTQGLERVSPPRIAAAA